jgi:hypothetical protein
VGASFITFPLKLTTRSQGWRVLVYSGERTYTVKTIRWQLENWQFPEWAPTYNGLDELDASTQRGWFEVTSLERVYYE